MRDLDYVKAIIIAAFGGSSELPLETLIARIHHSRKTVFYWLKNQEHLGLLDSYSQHSGKGRPVLIYRINDGLFRTPNHSELMFEEERASSPLVTEMLRQALPDQTLASQVQVSDQMSIRNVWVVVPFGRLKHACRFQEGDICTLPGFVQNCAPKRCGLIVS